MNEFVLTESTVPLISNLSFSILTELLVFRLELVETETFLPLPLLSRDVSIFISVLFLARR